MLAVHELGHERALLGLLGDEAVPVVAVEVRRLTRHDRVPARRCVEPVEEWEATEHAARSLVLRDQRMLDPEPRQVVREL